ncbi:MAG: FAD-dependent oxidoreductase, partial [Chloroflexota bacterium]
RISMTRSFDAIICGAGITGVATAHYLSKAGISNILLLDERPPLSFTSDRSTECYRNWWPDRSMLALMNRSIDLMEDLAHESGNVFRMNRRGYLYFTADESQIPALIERSKRTSNLGAGPLRVHTADSSSYKPAPEEGLADQPTGADLILGSELIQKYFPYVNPKAAAALHARRAGWLSAQQLGMYLLETARKRGVRFESERVEEVDVANSRVNGVRLKSGEFVNSPIFIAAPGPFLKEVGGMLGLDLPIYTELHLRAAIKDSLGVVPRNAPLLIWEDPQSLPWKADERAALAEDPEARWLTERFPPGVHTRPEGSGESQTILILWDFKTKVVDPLWPPTFDEQYPEIALRGLSTMLPRMKEYFARMPRPQLDGGCYTRTRENRPLIGPLGIRGAYIIGAVSGYGIMSACGAGDLLAAHVTGKSLPAYALTFELSRYQNPEYLKEIEAMDDTGQL